MGAVPGPLDGITTTYSSNRYLGLCPEGVDKGTGLLSLAQRLGVDPQDTLGAAGWRATSSCDDGVLAEIMEKVFPASRP